MAKPERRKNPRIKVHNCISYVCLNSKDNFLDPRMGFVRDVSQNGVCIETVCRVESGTVLLTFIDMDNNPVEINGRVAYSRKADSGRFKTGIHFEGSDLGKLLFVKKLVKSYHYEKGASRLASLNI